MRDVLKRLYVDQRGIGLLEYAGLAVLLLLAVWGVTKALGISVGNVFSDIKDKLGH
ncbi:hypothetical protein E308F_10410 [Moorella sp. E308F]|jgi:Flp pilus assembly pilin Flp|uniref:pilus assembly protein n=1 Tax=Moorella sp. E308F TaxID=2572682 RepID=UPI0010FFC307|nr:pilus assembly protein [Moorella sp. E308F]GEA14799.1 hypothetical protein E308F_10410 [Moorella sp. E308F]